MKQAVDDNLLSPLPIVLVGALVEGRPNYLVIGYISPLDFGKHVFFSMYKGRCTSLGVHENNTFSVNIPSDDAGQTSRAPARSRHFAAAAPSGPPHVATDTRFVSSLGTQIMCCGQRQGTHWR